MTVAHKGMASPDSPGWPGWIRLLAGGQNHASLIPCRRDCSTALPSVCGLWIALDATLREVSTEAYAIGQPIVLRMSPKRLFVLLWRRKINGSGDIAH